MSDEGDFWETRSLERLTKEIGDQSAMLAGFLGALKDAMGQAPGGAGTVEAPIAAYPNFEHLEAEGQRLLPEQLKAMLKALAQSNLLRGDTALKLSEHGTRRPRRPQRGQSEPGDTEPVLAAVLVPDGYARGRGRRGSGA